MKITKFIINDDLTVTVNGNVDIASRSLTELPVQFKKVYGYFWCQNNRLKTLVGCPEEVAGSFFCGKNPLESLKGAPKKVWKAFSCSSCPNLRTLKGAPKEVGGDFNCTDCPNIKTLRYVGRVQGYILSDLEENASVKERSTERLRKLQKRINPSEEGASMKTKKTVELKLKKVEAKLEALSAPSLDTELKILERRYTELKTRYAAETNPRKKAALRKEIMRVLDAEAKAFRAEDARMNRLD